MKDILSMMNSHKGPVATILTIGILAGGVLGYGWASYNLSENKLRKKILQDIRFDLKKKFRGGFSHVFNYTIENLEEAKKLCLKESRFISTAQLYIMPSQEIDILDDKYFMKMFKKEMWLIPKEDYIELIQKWKDILEKLPNGKGAQFDRLIEESKSNSDKLITETLKSHIKDLYKKL